MEITLYQLIFNHVRHMITKKLQGFMHIRFAVEYCLCTYLGSYLDSRFHYVDCDLYATSGIPQGYNLGHLIFNLYINNIGDELQVNHLLYAENF